MDIDKISEERLFQNNTKEEIKYWCTNLQYFHFMRARAGHNCEGDSLSVYLKYSSLKDLIEKLSKIGVTLTRLKEGFIAFDPTVSYSFDDLDKLRYTIPDSKNLEQPQYVKILGKDAHVWVSVGHFEISVSGTGSKRTYTVSSEDFDACMFLEKEFDKLGWEKYLDNGITAYSHCISKDKYPELYD